MAYEFVVEDGTGLAIATSYLSVEEADSYASFIGNTEWQALTIGDREKELILTTWFVDELLVWNGTPLTDTQALAFPRADLYDRYNKEVVGVPEKLKMAVMKLAVETVGESLEATPIKLKSQGWGSTREEYMGGYVEDELGIAGIKQSLAAFGYGSSTNIIEVFRA